VFAYHRVFCFEFIHSQENQVQNLWQGGRYPKKAVSDYIYPCFTLGNTMRQDLVGSVCLQSKEGDLSGEKGEELFYGLLRWSGGAGRDVTGGI